MKTSLESAYFTVQRLVETFKANEKYFLSPSYSEAEARKDFIDKFFIALGWDVYHDEQKNPYEQEVKVERGVSVEHAQKRADYAFYIPPNFRDPVFYVEAKKPAQNLTNADYYFQTVRYAWNTNTPVTVLTDFEEFHIIDARYKPNIKTVLDRTLQKFHYSEYTDKEKFAKIYYLFSRESVNSNSIGNYADTLKKIKGKAIQKGAYAGIYQSIDESFLEELDKIRIDLAKSFKKSNPNLNSEELTEASQRTIDRLVFLRFLEDKLIEPESIVSKFGNKNSPWKDFISTSKTLDSRYNGVVFKNHPVIDSNEFISPDDKVFGDICEGLSHAKSPYDFNAIPIHILGAIYERFLGKVIHGTEKHVKIEEKPEVRKAGGVYYTPQYIVKYIVDNTVGKILTTPTPAKGGDSPLIKGETGLAPKEIVKLRFADIACGSGSFLITVFDTLLQYHSKWYNEHPEEAKKDKCINNNGVWVLSLEQKRKILTNNIYGVDIDPQAVEVTQLSLFLKLLEDETTASIHQIEMFAKDRILPDLSKNIKCGNSLIGTDILNNNLFGGDIDEEKIKPMDFETSFPEVMKNGGFDAVVGNPPYVGKHIIMKELEKYIQERFEVGKGQYNLFSLFIEKSARILKQNGLLSYIIPSLFIKGIQYESLRQFINNNAKSFSIREYGDKVFGKVQMPTCVITLEKGANKCLLNFFFKIAENIFNKSKLIELENIANVTRGLEIGKDKLSNKGAVACITGGDIDNYLIKSIKYIDKEVFDIFKKSEDIFNKPKILIRETGNRIVATFDRSGIITTRSIYNVRLNNAKYDPKYILGLLNSELYKYYFRNFIAPDTNIFPKIRVKQVNEILIKPIDFGNSSEKSLHDKLVFLVEQMLEAKKKLNSTTTESQKNYYEDKCNALDRQIASLVYELYGLTEEEIKIVEDN